MKVRNVLTVLGVVLVVAVVLVFFYWGAQQTLIIGGHDGVPNH